MYRAASGLTYELVQSLDMALIDKIGYNEVGRLKWMILSNEEKYQLTFEIISDDLKYEKCLESTNFPSFLYSFRKSVGGADRQEIFIRNQLNVALKDINDLNEFTVATIRS